MSLVSRAEMQFGREQLKEFISKYKEHECLWKVNHKEYRNKRKRLLASQELLKIIRRTDPEAHLYSVSRKINSLRTSFNKEYNKVKSSYISGGDVRVPQLWYFDSMLFLVNQDTEDEGDDREFNQSVPNTEDSNNDQDDASDATTDDIDSFNVEPSPSTHRSIPRSASPQPTASVPKRRRVPVRSEHHQTKIQKPKECEEDDECSIYGELIAKKMRKLAEDRRDLMMIKIQQLFYEEMHERQMLEVSAVHGDVSTKIEDYDSDSP